MQKLDFNRDDATDFLCRLRRDFQPDVGPIPVDDGPSWTLLDFPTVVREASTRPNGKGGSHLVRGEPNCAVFRKV